MLDSTGEESTFSQCRVIFRPILRFKWRAIAYKNRCEGKNDPPKSSYLTLTYETVESHQAQEPASRNKYLTGYNIK
jgi:hypothetical protein